jgi:hypothetical protein
MRRYKIAACILLILSVFGFVLAAPIPVHQVREACADAVGGGDSVIIESGKRAEVQDEEDPLLTQAQQEPSSSSDWRSTPSQDQGSSSATNYARAFRWKPSFLSGGGKPPLLSTSGGVAVPRNPLAEGEAKLIEPPLLSTSGATEVPWNPLAEGKANLIKPPLLSTSGGIEVPWNPLAEGKANLIHPASSSKAKSVSWSPEREVILPSGGTYSEMLPPDSRPAVKPLRRPKKAPPKNIFSKLFGKLKFWRRISGTAGGVVTEG